MINNWDCNSCKGYNDILNERCSFCKDSKPKHITGLLQGLVEIKRDVILHYVYQSGDKMSMTRDEELFVKFYNSGKILVIDMDVATLREHRDKLSQIVIEAKANLRAADDELREKTARSGKKEWLTTVDSDQSVSDAIHVVEQRAKRMSKMDKLRKDLLKTLDEETVDEMIKNLERKATEKNISAITFKSPAAEEIVVVEMKPTEAPKPFDPSSLKFGS